MANRQGRTEDLIIGDEVPAGTYKIHEPTEFAPAIVEITPDDPILTARELRVTPIDMDGEPVGSAVDITRDAVITHAGSYPAYPPEPGDQISVNIPNPDPVAVYLLTGGAAGHAPIPTAYRAEWWPAAVRVPGRPQPIGLAKVYATAEGLYVYSEAPDAGDPNGTHPDFYSPIDYDKTPRPATGYAAQQAGIKLATGAGDVIVQQLGGCGCAKRALGSWRPGWGSRIEPWEG